MYMACNILSFTEEQFWRMTPRKLFALYDMHCKCNGLGKYSEGHKESNGVRKGYIDEIF